MGSGLQSPYIPRGRRLPSGDFYISLRAPASSVPFGALAIPVLLPVGGFAHGVVVCEVLLRLPQDSVIKPFLLEHKAEVIGMCTAEYKKSKFLAKFKIAGNFPGVIYRDIDRDIHRELSWTAFPENPPLSALPIPEAEAADF